MTIEERVLSIIRNIDGDDTVKPSDTFDDILFDSIDFALTSLEIEQKFALVIEDEKFDTFEKVSDLIDYVAKRVGNGN